MDYPSVGNSLEDASNQAASAQQQVTLTFYVLDGGVNGPVLPGVEITAYDASGKSSKVVTNSKGAVTINGQPGTWRFTISKEGYETINSYYDVTETQSAATYLRRITQAQEQVTLTIYVHDGNLTGLQLSGVQVAGQDAAGNSFDQLTGKEGSAVINGVPGTWQFMLSKDGYETASLNYNVTTTQAGAAYLKKNIQAQEQVALTIYIHEGNLTGPQLSGVQVAGQDAAGNVFSQLTSLNGSVVIHGQPGRWQFTLSKEGYMPVILNYNITVTTVTAAYLPRIAI